MALITWQNVPIPDVGGTEQQGIRTAADLFNSAAHSATAGVMGLQAIQGARDAAEHQAADRFALENMLSTQDPAKYNQMVADGSILGPAAGKVSNSTLMAMEQRSNDLYTLGRQRTRDQEMQAADAVWNRAAPVAVNNPEEAQKILGRAHFTDTRDAAAFSEAARKLYVDPEHGASARDRAKKEEQVSEAYRNVDKLLGYGDQNPEGKAQFLETIQDPVVKQLTIDRANQLHENTPAYYSSAPAPNPGGPAITDGPENAMFKQFGNNLSMGRAAAGPSNPDPGSPEWVTQNGGRVPTQADVMNWTNTYVKPSSEKARGKGQGSTAIGPAQVLASTRADVINRYGKQMFGTTDPKKIPYTLENEDKIAGKVYKDQGPEAWQATKNYAGFKDPSTFKDRPWGDAKPLLYYIDGGVAPASYQTKIKQFESTLEDRKNGLSEGAKVILNARPNEGWGLSEAAEDLIKTYGKETRPGEATQLVEETVRNAKEAGTTINYAEAVGLIKNAVHDERLWNFDNLHDKVDIWDDKLAQTAKDLGNARADLKSYDKNMETLNRVKELQQQYAKDHATARSQLAQAKDHADAGTSALNAFKKWQETSDQIAKLVAATPKGAVSNGLVEDARPATAHAPPGVPMPQNMDLMLDPKRPDAAPQKFGSNAFNAR